MQTHIKYNVESTTGIFIYEINLHSLHQKKRQILNIHTGLYYLHEIISISKLFGT